MKHDIAVLEHKNQFKLNSQVAILALPVAQSGEWMKHDDDLRICGWGNIQYPGNSYPDELRCVDVKYITVSDCNARSKYAGAILEGMFCAGWNGGGKDACQGDSGGPVKRIQRGTNTELVGAVSWGYGCAQAQYPGVYADVGYYRGWINEQM